MIIDLTPDAVAALAIALRSGEQADMDGVMVRVSRQACEEAADLLEALAARLAEVEAQLDTLAGASVEAIGTAAHAVNGWKHWMDRAEAAEARADNLAAELAEAALAEARTVRAAAKVLHEDRGSGVMEVVRLVFMNADATPKNVAVEVSRASVPHIMAWYGAYFAGDRYTVAIDGRNIQMDQNGEPLP